MENASKALIIAGAILLAILIIGLGVFIYNQAANTVSNTGMDQVAARQFNGQFEPYLNREISSSAAKSLMDTIELNNRVNGDDKYINYNRSMNFKLGHKYIVTPEYDGARISGLYIEDVNAGLAAKEYKEVEAEFEEEVLDCR